MIEEPFGSITLPSKLQNLYLEISEHLRHRGRFSLPQHLRLRIEQFVDRQIEYGTKIIEKDTVFYRARIADVGSNELFKLSEMGAPPKGKAASGRINPEGIPYLYLADSPATAIAEVRPWKNAEISVGIFKTTRQVKVVSFNSGDQLSSAVTFDTIETPETLSEVNSVINGLVLKVLYFSVPAHSNDKHAYLASQCSGQLIPDSKLDRSSAFAGGTPLLH
ncbi:RES family NAD+ phosphorylase [Rheinheimera baltica]|uniref:RES family NAD+ phosphorylase n=1 Tax=Rheinheimera baltica TaxID=67576 RepID=A0ABT9I4F2_9GAMM|nr:RES family NAD+ phosphorylase [Rheinheimera baltica]MDP5137851.1 RES family NAD+ phosphorylase [Rheinheimera baltica]